MITAAIIALLLAVVMAAVAMTAPEGWQDERGFHYGKPDE